MPDVDTSMYKTLGQNNNPLKQPLEIMQLLGAVNQNKLFNQTYDSREKIGNAWRDNVGPDGKINNQGLMRAVAGAGFLAPEAAGQAISNSTNQFGLDTNKLNFAQKTIGALAADPNVWQPVRQFLEDHADLSFRQIGSLPTVRSSGAEPNVLVRLEKNVELKVVVEVAIITIR